MTSIKRVLKGFVAISLVLLLFLVIGMLGPQASSEAGGRRRHKRVRRVETWGLNPILPAPTSLVPPDASETMRKSAAVARLYAQAKRDGKDAWAERYKSVGQKNGWWDPELVARAMQSRGLLTQSAVVQSDVPRKQSFLKRDTVREAVAVRTPKVPAAMPDEAPVKPSVNGVSSFMQEWRSFVEASQPPKDGDWGYDIHDVAEQHKLVHEDLELDAISDDDRSWCVIVGDGRRFYSFKDSPEPRRLARARTLAEAREEARRRISHRKFERAVAVNKAWAQHTSVALAR